MRPSCSVAEPPSPRCCTQTFCNARGSIEKLATATHRHPDSDPSLKPFALLNIFRNANGRADFPDTNIVKCSNLPHQVLALLDLLKSAIISGEDCGHLVAVAYRQMIRGAPLWSASVLGLERDRPTTAGAAGCLIKGAAALCAMVRGSLRFLFLVIGGQAPRVNLGPKVLERLGNRCDRVGGAAGVPPGRFKERVASGWDNPVRACEMRLCGELAYGKRRCRGSGRWPRIRAEFRYV